MQSDRQARIRERAHQIWLDEGQADGKDAEHWHRAEHEVAAEEEKTQASGKRGRAKPADVAEPKSETPPRRATGTTSPASRGSRPTTK